VLRDDRSARLRRQAGSPVLEHVTAVTPWRIRLNPASLRRDKTPNDRRIRGAATIRIGRRPAARRQS
jgi:hypothetical protein